MERWEPAGVTDTVSVPGKSWVVRVNIRGREGTEGLRTDAAG